MLYTNTNNTIVLYCHRNKFKKDTVSFSLRQNDILLLIDKLIQYQQNQQKMKLSFKVASLVVINSLASSVICNAEENSTEIANNFTDVDASKNSEPSDMDMRADGPWLQRGEFVLERRPLFIPDDGPQVFWNCAGG